MDNYIENKTIQTRAWTYSLVLYAGLLLTLYFIKIVYEPPQEDMGFGVDLNYGVDLVGSGDIQTMNKANDSKNAYDVKPEAGAKANVKATPTPSKPKPETQKTVKSTPAKVLTSNEDTKVTVKEPVEKSKPATKPAAETSKAAPEKTTPAPPQPQRTVDNSSIMKKSSGSGGATGSNGTTGTRDGVGGNNNGDGKPGEVGDKGDPRGTPDGKSLYGNPGKGGPGPGGSGGSGTSVSISGWKNKGNLNINKDNSSETGTIVFDVVINDFGDVINIKNRPTSLSPSVVSYYREQIRSKLKSTLQAEGTPPSRSSGTITIRITRG